MHITLTSSETWKSVLIRFSSLLCGCPCEHVREAFEEHETGSEVLENGPPVDVAGGDDAVGANECFSDLERAAVWLQERAAKRGSSVGEEAAARGVTDKTFLRRAHAAAEASLLSQQACLEKTLRYIKDCVAAQRMEEQGSNSCSQGFVEKRLPRLCTVLFSS